MSVTCECGQPVADAFVCATCAAGLARDLGDVAEWLADELDTMLARLAVFGDGRGGARQDQAEPWPDEVPGASVQPLPFDKAASEAVYVLRSTLASTARLVAEERGVSEPGAHVRAIPRPTAGDWTSTEMREAYKGAQRCNQTDLLVEACAHCRRAS